MKLFRRHGGRHMRCSGWGDLAAMVAAYRAYPIVVPPVDCPALTRKSNQEKNR
ncbi:hypothetical protein [Sphaerisporangium album]|uniref:hypothetical protein n=1 Tax=Sphaerisporangium album TaxID=509200 RepID=UPI0015F0E19B|nr:hypothetical protein [Sphaerisporangium album]